VTEIVANRAEPGIDPERELERLAELAGDALARCRAAGASSAEVGVSSEHGLNVNVRLGEVETLEHTRDRGLAVTVYFGQRKASANTADLAPASIAATIAQACAIARYTEADPYAGLADPARMATYFADLDLWHPWALDAERAIELGATCEQAGRDLDARISNSDGASVSTTASLSVYANSHGFVGRERGTRHSLSCSLIGETAHGMQRDYWYSTARDAADLEDAAAVGREAAARTLRRLGARQLGTRQCPVLFVPEVARSLIGHLVSAVSGGALYRRASFLLDSAGRQIFPGWLTIREEPLLRRGHGSAAFDAEGVATAPSDLVRDGVLARYVLGSYSARRLGLASTGNAGGVHNLVLGGATLGFDELLREMGEGLVVTELMGQGVNVVTGDYSRGGAGFWVENGAIAYPVEEITIAANLREMYAQLRALGNDVDRRSHILTGSMLIARMTVAGA
jgi:PmbA protein